MLVISQTGEKIIRINANKKNENEKKEGTVVIESNMALNLKTAKERVFYLVQGLEAVPVYVDLNNSLTSEIYCTLSVK